MPLPAGVVVLERGWLSSNNIVLVGSDSTAIVDTGYSTHSAQTVALVERVLGGRDLDVIVNTHLHSDHCGGNAALQVRYQESLTFIPPGLSAQVLDWDPVALSFEPTGQSCPRFRFDSVLEPGTTIELGHSRWEIHAAPGHDRHSIILFEPGTRTLISADALWRNGFGVVFQELEGNRAFDEVASTLNLIERLSPSTVIPGHGAVFTEVSDALSQSRRRLDAFVSSPERHATHAVKVLLVFKLLELERIPEPDFLAWAFKTPYFPLVHGRYFSGSELQSWLEKLIADLIRARAIQREGTFLRCN